MRVLSAVVLTSAVAAAVAYSNGPRERGPGGHCHKPPHSPVLETFDTDRDGEVSAAEMENAGAALAALDSNGDGVLSADELPRPPRRGPHEHGRPGPPPRHDDDRPTPPRDRPELEAIENGADSTQGTVTIRGGYETDARDRGRPVALIAAALGVEPQVFRDAFSGVTPARGGDPTPAHARANKQVLMDALGPHGVTNDRLDEVSNYYRYQPQDGGLWQHTPAQASAVIEDGKVVAVEITNAGSGYTTPPQITIAGHGNVQIEATIEFSTDLKTNGRVTSLSIVE